MEREGKRMIGGCKEKEKRDGERRAAVGRRKGD